MAEKSGTKGQWSVAQNMADWCNYLTFDTLGDLCFGKAFEMLEHEENRHVIDLIGNAANMHLIVSRSTTSPITFNVVAEQWNVRRKHCPVKKLTYTAWNKPEDQETGLEQNSLS